MGLQDDCVLCHLPLVCCRFFLILFSLTYGLRFPCIHLSSSSLFVVGLMLHPSSHGLGPHGEPQDIGFVGPLAYYQCAVWSLTYAS